MDNIEEKLHFFRGLLSSVANIYHTTLDADFRLLYSNAPHLDVFLTFFCLDAGYDEVLKQAEGGKLEMSGFKGRPVICTNSVGMTWISDIEYRDVEIYKIYIIGPVFLDDYSVQVIEKGLARLHLTVKMRHQFMDIIKELPVVSLNRFFEYGIMLHYCLTDGKIGVHDFVYADVKEEIPEQLLEEKHGTYMAEANILKLVEDGNLSYKKEMDKYVTAGKQGKVSNGDYLRQAKNSVIIFCALCARAAIKGGIAPETAYVLSDQYIQKTESAETLAMVHKVSRNMMDDYVRRVHYTKSDLNISPQIKESCDYIGLHLDEKQSIHFLASRIGYSDYYFSEKFKKETGMSVREYTMKKKVEMAQEYLRHSNMSIQDISNELGYSSQSYFGEVFREQTGESPREYRIKYHKG